MTDPHFERARLLLDQERHELAAQELRQSLANDPSNANAHALLALCLLPSEAYDSATEEAEQAIHLAPDHSFTHYVLSTVLSERNRFPEAEIAIREALALDSLRPAYFGRLAEIKFATNRWQESLAAAEQGLQLDPEDRFCTNLRVMSLVKLGRTTEAGEAVQRSLEKRPEDALTHANLGWTLIEQGDHTRALDHFRESLRIDPTLDWARSGIVEALKSKYFVYRVMLGYFLWMMKLSGRARWGILLGGYFGFRLLGRVARDNPDLAPWILPFLICYGVFVIMTWIASPLFNLLLRLNRFGRLALSRKQIVTSNWVGGCLLGVAVSVPLAFLIGSSAAVCLGLTCAFAIPPLSAIYSCHQGWPRMTMVAITVSLVAVGLTDTGLTIANTFWGEATPTWLINLDRALFSLFIFAAIGSQLAANALVSVVPRK